MAITKTTSPENVNLTGNGIWFSLSSNLVDSFVSNLQIVLVVEYYNGTAWVALQTATKPVIGGVAMFNVQHYLDKVPVPAFTYPESADNLIVNHPGACVKFRIKWNELYFNTTTNAYVSTAQVTDSGNYYTIQGGIPTDVERIFNQAATTFYNELVLNKQFLTAMPREVEISERATVKLYWLLRAGENYLRLYVKKYFADGTTSIVLLSSKSVAAYSVNELICSPSKIFTEEELPGIYKYEIWCTNATTTNIISEIRTFTINRRYFERNDYFLFQNSAGSFDFLWAHGRKKETIGISKLNYSLRLPYAANLSNREMFNSRGQLTKTRQSEIGFITKELLHYLQEFFTSENIIWLNNSIPVPALNVTEQAELVDDSNDMQSLPFLWRPDTLHRYHHSNYIALQSPLPPYFDYAIAMFDRRVGANLIDKINALEATIDSTGVTFPTLTPDIFNKTNATYWGATIPNTAGNNRKWLFSELSWEFMVDYATDAAHGTLFLKDFGSDIRSTLPILVFSPVRSEAQQNEIVTYLETYSFLVDTDGSIIIDTDNAYIVDGTI